MSMVGKTAPDHHFAIADGNRKKLSDWQGMTVVVYFYPKDDTPGCTREAQDFSSLAADFAKLNSVVIGISKDSTARHQKFADKYGLSVILGSDPDGILCEAFGVWVEKSLYGRQYMGIERASFLIDQTSQVVQEWRKVKVAGHAESVLEAVRRSTDRT